MEKLGEGVRYRHRVKNARAIAQAAMQTSRSRLRKTTERNIERRGGGIAKGKFRRLKVHTGLVTPDYNRFACSVLVFSSFAKYRRDY